MEILKKLNPAQKEAVEFNEASHIIVAGPGTGKTRVLTAKLIHLIEKEDYDPAGILVFTFTNQAADNMKKQIREVVGDKANDIWMGTFHSVLATILRNESKKLEYETNFSIYDKEDSVALVNSIINELNIVIDNHNANTIHHRISSLKNHMISPAEFIKHNAKTAADKKFATIYQEYDNRLFSNNSMDFDDLLLKPIELFNNNARVLQKYRKLFKYILVDDFQDTNKAQYEILKHLASGKAVVCAAGDDSQSIYGWRGADLTNITEFENDFAKAKVFRFEQNYRSTQNIIKAAESVIKNNKDRIKKVVKTDNPEGEQLTVIKCADEKDEAVQIVKQIKKEISSKKLSLNDISVLFRINSQSRALEDGFRKNKIPYKIIGGTEFYRRKEVKDIVAYLRILANQNDEESLLRIMNFPQRGIGNTSISKMISFARKLDISLFTTMSRVFEVIEVKERIQKNVKQFKLLLDKYVDLKDQLSLYELASALVDELGILRMYKDENSADSKQKLENATELLNSIKEFTEKNSGADLDTFLADVSLITGIDQLNESENSVTLMTAHNAKGLEFPVVFVTGLEEDIFPLHEKFDPDATEEEERRLFYMSVTRAEKKAFLTYARSRYRFGEVAYQSRSKFIEELDEATYTEITGGVGRKSSRRRKSADDEYQEESDDMDQERRSLRVGSRVTHELFGNGKILQLTGAGETQRVTVQFEEKGTKTLLLKVANLKLI